MRAAKCMIVVVATLFVSACALVEGPQDESDPSDEPTSQVSAESTTPGPGDSTSGSDPVDPEAHPLAFDAEAKTILPEKPVYDGLVVGPRLITMTLEQLRARSLPELETAWQIAPNGLFVDVDTRDEHLYVLDLRVEEGTGTRAGRLAMTLSRISPETGTVLDEVAWQRTQDVQASGDPVVQIAAIMDDVVLVESTGGGENSRRTLTAVDVVSGEELWTRRPGSLVAATDDGAVVMSTAAGTEPGSLVAVDAETGAASWNGPRGIAAADLVGIHEDTITLVTSSADGSDAELVSLSLTDGSVTGRSSTALADWSCHPAEETVVVCSQPGERAIGFDLETGEQVWQLPTAGRYGIWVSSVRGGYVYGFTSGGRPVVLDAETGRDVTDTAGAAPVSSNGYGGLVLYSGQAIFYPADPEQTEPPQ